MNWTVFRVSLLTFVLGSLLGYALAVMLHTNTVQAPDLSQQGQDRVAGIPMNPVTGRQTTKQLPATAGTPMDQAAFMDALGLRLEKRLAGMLRKMKGQLHDELLREVQNSGPALRGKTPQQAELTETDRLALEKAEAVIVNAVQKGQWEQADQNSFSDITVQMSEAAFAEAHRKLAEAINQGEIKPGEDLKFLGF